MKDPDKITLINYRIDQAKESIKEVGILIKNNLLNVAVNRIYYGMFYILLALAIKYDFKTSKHRQLIGWFNKSFIKTKRIEKKYGEIINDAFENRSDVDYGIFIKIKTKDVEGMYSEMKEFINEIIKFLKE